MEQTVRFLHTADLHIGAPVRGFCSLADAWAERLQRAVIEAYDRVIDAAIKNDVDFVVIAGDVFDTARASFGDFLHFFEGLERLDAAGIPSFLVGGNHDPFSSWRLDAGRFPASARLMGGEGPEFALFERDGEPICLIGARGYRNQAWPIDEPMAQGITRLDAVLSLKAEHPLAAQAPFSVGIIHTGLDPDQSKAYCDSHSLMCADMDYWACGHLHNRCALPSEAAPRIVFPGCIQGLDVKESGERGCFLVTMERAGSSGPVRTSLEFVPTASVALNALEVDVSACQTLADVTRLVISQLFHENALAGCDEMVARVVLVGETGLHGFLAKGDVIRDMRRRLNNAYPTFFCDALIDRTRPAHGRENLSREGLFTGQVLRVADRQRSRADEMVNFIQAEFVKRGIDVPSSLARRIGEFDEAAETLVFDLLEEADDAPVFDLLDEEEL